MKTWQPDSEQKKKWESDGYFVVRGLVAHDAAMEARGIIRNHIISPEHRPEADQADPMDPMGDSPDAREARYRKLAQFCERAPVIWHQIHASESILQIARYFLGDDVLVKFTSCFLKPARTGSATPWHQDNGLWRDGESDPLNFWLAVDPATRTNGCLQFIPGSHRTEIVEHVLYPDSIHGELPRDRVEDMKDRNGIEHIELAPGDAVFWHSNLWHYSPPNRSEQSRIAVAGVYTTPEIVERTGRSRAFLWALRSGKVCTEFPPDAFTVETGVDDPPKPWPKAETP